MPQVSKQVQLCCTREEGAQGGVPEARQRSWMISRKLRFWETFLTLVSFRDFAPWQRCQGGGADLEPQGRGQGVDLKPQGRGQGADLELQGKGRGAGRGLQGKVEETYPPPEIGAAVGDQFPLGKGAIQEGGQIQ